MLAPFIKQPVLQFLENRLRLRLSAQLCLNIAPFKMCCFRRTFVLAALCLLAGTVCLRASSFTWTGTASTAWQNPTHWSPNGVPGPADSATITTGSPNAPSITNAVSISTIVLGGGTLTATAPGSLAVAAGFTWTNGVFKGVLTINSGATMSFSNSTGVLDMPGSSLVNNGTVVWSAGQIRGDSNMAITNNGAWLVQTDNQINNAYGGTPNFYNNGTLTKTIATNLT